MSMNVSPNLGYRDADAAIRFLVDAFGFELVARYDGPSPGSIAFAQLRWHEGGGIMIYSAPAGRRSVADLAVESADGYPAFSVHVDTRDPDAVHARATAAGAVIQRELQDSPVGTRGFIARDTEGLFWSFGTPLQTLVKTEEGWSPAGERARGQQ